MLIIRVTLNVQRHNLPEKSKRKGNLQFCMLDVASLVSRACLLQLVNQ